MSIEKEFSKLRLIGIACIGKEEIPCELGFFIVPQFNFSSSSMFTLFNEESTYAAIS